MEIVDDFVIEVGVQEFQELLEAVLDFCDAFLLVHVLDDGVLEVNWYLMNMQREQHVIKHLLYLLVLALLLLHFSSDTTKDIGHEEGADEEHSGAKDDFSLCLGHNVIPCDQQDRVITELDVPRDSWLIVELGLSIGCVIQVDLWYPIVIFKLI